MYGTEIQIGPMGAQHNPSQLQERSVSNNFRGDYLYSGTKKSMFNQWLLIFSILISMITFFKIFQ